MIKKIEQNLISGFNITFRDSRVLSDKEKIGRIVTQLGLFIGRPITRCKVLSVDT
jgi:hypothetical protein